MKMLRKMIAKVSQKKLYERVYLVTLKAYSVQAATLLRELTTDYF